LPAVRGHLVRTARSRVLAVNLPARYAERFRTAVVCRRMAVVRSSAPKRGDPMAVENIIGSGNEVRLGLIDEAAQIPAHQFSFQQLTVYERLLGIELALTHRFRKAFGETPP
jgi:hypothetical protein